MTATIDIAPDIAPNLTKSLEDLENVRSVSEISAEQGNTTYPNLGELGSVPHTFFIMYDSEKLKVLRILGGVLLEARRRVREVVQFIAVQDRGTEECPVPSELEGKANDACVEFCNSHRLTTVLNSCLNQISLFFSNIENLSADLGYFEDEGNEDSGHVVIRLETRTDQDTMLDEYDRWVDWFIDNLSATNRTLFTLTVSRI